MKGLKIDGENYTFQYTINGDDYARLLYFNAFIEHHAKLGNRLPAKLMQKFLSFLDDQREYNEAITKTFEICDKAKEHFSEDQDYQFSAKIRIENSDFPVYLLDEDKIPKFVKVSFDEMIYLAVWTSHKVATDIRIKSSDKKDVMIQEVYDYVVQYLNRLPKTKKDHAKPYRIYTIVAFIMKERGYKYSSKANPTNHELYQGIRYSLDKIARKQKSGK